MKEEKLVKKAIKGNAGAFEELLMLHSERLYRTAFLYVGNREDALDIVQETSCKAFLAIGQLKKEEYFLTWLTRILIHCTYDVLRKRKKEMPVEKLIELPVSSEHQVAESLDLIEAVSMLKEQYRSAIILFYYHDMPLSEIARTMDIPENTVKTYLQRGRKELKTRLGGVPDGKENVS
ncbi:sigma-70 family RNA polymerase sigma factor [Mesobacillus jeotgali]|uniref:sigma-70 family RNA polymerase sigma factor n=1 Tax=Mesobacillus jeotgali TaxID=129985 RepID=UPI0009A8ED49|nr:sigma-70 family RNA polymerase sigma factor [Mesobacillus jeotgali]